MSLLFLLLRGALSHSNLNSPTFANQVPDKKANVAHDSGLGRLLLGELRLLLFGLFFSLEIALRLLAGRALVVLAFGLQRGLL